MYIISFLHPSIWNLCVHLEFEFLFRYLCFLCAYYLHLAQSICYYLS